jgi:2-methylcitrate dehydratase PrpD
VLTALLAKKGITGAMESIEGKAGLLNLYQRGEYDSAVLVQDLGTTFEVEKLSYKPYPCCRYTHAAIDVVLEITRRHDIKPEQIEEVIVSVSKEAYEDCEPKDTKANPRTIVDAQFSIPYTVSVALVKKKVGIADFTDKAINNGTVLAVSNQVKCLVSVEPNDRMGRGIAPCRVSVNMSDGNSVSNGIEVAKGHPSNPMTWEELSNKVQDCIEVVRAESSAWQELRNNKGAKVNWQFTTDNARTKLKPLYPTFDT